MRIRFVIADTTPVTALSLLGREGLDLLLVTDAVRDELLEEPEPGDDASRTRRADLAAWIAMQEATGTLTELPTALGRLYRDAVANWRDAGSPPRRRPSRRDLGEASIVSVLSGLAEAAGPDATTFVLMDDRAGRAAIRALGIANLDLMGTAAYLALLAGDYAHPLAANAWTAIATAADTLDHGVEGDPVRFRR